MCRHIALQVTWSARSSYRFSGIVDSPLAFYEAWSEAKTASGWSTMFRMKMTRTQRPFGDPGGPFAMEDRESTSHPRSQMLILIKERSSKQG